MQISSNFLLEEWKPFFEMSVKYEKNVASAVNRPDPDCSVISEMEE
jgi:hypothetical protein